MNFIYKLYLFVLILMVILLFILAFNEYRLAESQITFNNWYQAQITNIEVYGK